MAKASSIIKLQGTIAGLTFVRSRAYGDHVRAKRGTYKKADVNDVLKQESKILLRANVPAKIFKDAIDPYLGQFKTGMLWQRLVSVFRKQLKTQGAIDFGQMERFEIWPDYPLSKFMNVQSAIAFKKEKSLLQVDIAYDGHPAFRKVKSINGYKFTVIGIFPSLKKKTAVTVDAVSEVIAMEGPVAPVRVKLSVPSKSKVFAVCLKIEGCIDGEVSNTRMTEAMCVVGAGGLSG